MGAQSRTSRLIEIGQLSHQIIQHAKKIGVSVPTHDTIKALIETFDWKVYHRMND